MNTIQLDTLVVRGGQVIDPVTGRDEIADVAITGGRLADSAPKGAKVFDASGCIVCPGLLDIHVHLRDPGFEHKETIETGTLAAAAGGFTFVACMPNTNPPIDTPETVRYVLDKARQAPHCDVGPIAAITHGRQGQQLTDFKALLEAGAVAFSDDGDGVSDDAVMREAFRLAAECGTVLLQHCEYRSISAGGVMHLGEVSKRLGLPGLDPRSEQAMIERDIALCRETPARYHVTHVSTARSVDLVRNAKADGLPITAEVCPHHLMLTDESCAGLDPNTKMHPPLRTSVDMEACRKGLVDGTIDCIASDHASHCSQEKSAGFLDAPPGIVGLETALPLAAKAMIETGLADWPALIAWFTVGPANVLGLSAPSTLTGTPANLTIIDPGLAWTVDPERFASKGRNTPFAGWEVTGKALATIRGRRMSLSDSDRFA